MTVALAQCLERFKPSPFSDLPSLLGVVLSLDRCCMIGSHWIPLDPIEITLDFGEDPMSFLIKHSTWNSPNIEKGHGGLVRWEKT